MLQVTILIPEFPGQTHSFFWREIRALQRHGVSVSIASTRRPPPEVVSHTWSAEAIARTSYLVPMSPFSFFRALAVLARAGPVRLSKVLRVIARVDGSVGQKIWMLCMALVGGRLADLARRNGWRHIHVHSCGDAAAIAMFADLLTSLPYSLTLHGEIGGYGVSQHDKWRNAAFGIAVAPHLKHVLLRDLQIAADKVDVAAMGVDLSRFCRDSGYLPADTFGECRIVSCGRLHQGKGHQDLLRATAALREKGLDVSLRILGEGPARGALETLIKELRLDSFAHLTGAVSEELVRMELERAHVFVLASHGEATSVATMEAMAMGLPVVVTRVGGAPNLVRHGVDGLLVPPKDPNALSDAIEEILRQPQRARTMGEAGAQRIAGAFSDEVSARTLVSRLRHRKSQRVWT